MDKNWFSELLTVSEQNGDWYVVLRSILRRQQWSLMNEVCKCELKFTPQAFSEFVAIFRGVCQSEECTDVKSRMELLMKEYQVVPFCVETPKDVSAWNQQLADYYVLANNKEATNREAVDAFVFDWWVQVCEKHSEVSIVSLIENTVMIDDCYKSNWDGVFSSNVLLERGYYFLLLLMGEIPLLRKAGKNSIVIDNFSELRFSNESKRRDHLIHYARMFSEKDMLDYLDGYKGDYLFFVYHPNGLETLIKADCIGCVMMMANRFMGVYYNFPNSFYLNGVTRLYYGQLLEKVLDCRL